MSIGSQLRTRWPPSKSSQLRTNLAINLSLTQNSLTRGEDSENLRLELKNVGFTVYGDCRCE
jgi:hypothetical protein